MVLREGPDTPTLSIVVGSSASIVNNTFTNNTYALSGAKADTVLRGGRWHFDVKVESVGSLRIGVCAPRFAAAAETDLGMDAHSWAYDGNGNIYHAGKQVTIE